MARIWTLQRRVRSLSCFITFQLNGATAPWVVTTVFSWLTYGPCIKSGAQSTRFMDPRPIQGAWSTTSLPAEARLLRAALPSPSLLIPEPAPYILICHWVTILPTPYSLIWAALSLFEACVSPRAAFFASKCRAAVHWNTVSASSESDHLPPVAGQGRALTLSLPAIHCGLGSRVLTGRTSAPSPASRQEQFISYLCF